jgi:hypothetical protein
MIWVVYSGSRIRILTFYPSRILDQGVKKAPDPGSGSATLVLELFTLQRIEGCSYGSISSRAHLDAATLGRGASPRKLLIAFSTEAWDIVLKNKW